MARTLALLALLLLAGSPLLLARQAPPADERPFAIRAQPVPLDADDRARTQVGELHFLGGWTLTSDDPDFGGISGMAIDGDGFLAVGDAGGLFRFALDGAGRVTRAAIDRLAEGPAPEDGGPVQKRDRDAESVAIDRQTGQFWVGFERANAVWRYDLRSGGAQGHAAPPVMADWPHNGGAEALVRLADGRFLVFSEAGRGPGRSNDALLFPHDPATGGDVAMRFGYRAPDGYRITDAAMIDASRLLILNRRFSLMEGVSVVVTMLDLDAIRDGAVLEGREIARFDPPLTVDNFEALAVTREAGRTIVWIASDDNFNPLQRTLLMKFALIEN